MWAEIVGGLLGAAVGVGLYRLGWYAARRTPRAAERSAATPVGVPAVTAMTPQEWQSFLNYDGGMSEKEQ